MSLVKKMRKSKTKIMVGLLVFIMLGFILGTSLPAMFRQLTIWRQNSEKFASYGDNDTISRQDLIIAKQDLEILKQLMADRFLMISQNPMGGINFRARLLGQVLFPDSGMSSYVNSELKGAIMQGQLQASQADLDEFFLQIKGSGDHFWVLLNKEAKNAGISVSNDQAKQVIKQIVNSAYQGQGDAARLVASISSKYHLKQDQIISTFADLLGILEYANTVTTFEDVTLKQLKSLIGHNSEKINAEFVKFQVDRFNADIKEPSESQVQEHFQKYKSFKSGDITEDNPYGFGYAQPATAELEYFIVNNSDVKSTITDPTDQEMEDYYTNNTNEFTSERPVDPNKPDGEKVTETKEYVEVAGKIRNTLINQKADAKTELIMGDALSMMEADIAGLEAEKVTAELYKEKAADFAKIAKKITDKYGVKVSTGKTGKLSQSNLSLDYVLGRFIKESKSFQGVELPKIVFAVDELGETILGKFDMATPKLWQPIGPLKNRFGTTSGLVRIVGANKGFVPESIDLKYSIAGPSIGLIDASTKEYVLKNEVIEDVKIVNTMQVAKEKAEEFVKMLEKMTWEEAVEKFNKDNSKEPIRRVSLEKQENKSRSTELNKKFLEEMAQSNLAPSMMAQLRQNMINSLLQEKLYDLIPEGKKEIKNAKDIFAFEPEQSYYLIKDVSLTEPTDNDYKESKAARAFMLNNFRSGKLALAHFAPDNITSRMNFEWEKKQAEEETDEGADIPEDGE